MIKAPIVCVLALGMLTLSQAADAQTPEVETPARLPSAQAVIDWAIDARGGREALQNIKTRKARGTYRQSNDTFEADVYIFQQRPRLIRSETLLYNGELVVRVVGEHHAWQSYNGDRSILAGKARAQAQRNAAIDGLTDWKDYYRTAEMVGVEDLDGSKAWVVRLTADDGLWTELLFNTETKLLVAKREDRHIDDERTYPILIKYSIFKDFDAIVLPTKIEQIQGEGDNRVTLTTTIKSYQHNVRLPRDSFQVSPEIKALIDERSDDG